MTQPAKSRMLGELGREELLLPELVNRGLVANDRAKYLLTLLQSARRHADAPATDVSDLARERRSVGLDEPRFDTTVQLASRQDDGRYLVPEAAAIHDRLIACLAEMLAPLEVPLEGEDPPPAAPFRERLATLQAAVAAPDDGVVSSEYLAWATSGARELGDSLHLLIMDLHRELNRLQGRIAGESVAGAQAYGLGPGDAELVTAFMTGVRRTAPLRFDHPGLGTTATRIGSRLVIQNDIGMTEAHLLVVHVEGLTVEITYTDVHEERLRFFQGLFEGQGTFWSGGEHRHGIDLTEDGGDYILTRGAWTASGREALQRYLDHLGSRLVFLIDWNRARKRLRRLIRGGDAMALLSWAARQDYGHMAFLLVGGERAVYDALQTASRVPVRPGDHLDDLLGRKGAIDLLQQVLRIASEGLREGRSTFLIRDEIRAELVHRLLGISQPGFSLASAHASLVVELAMAVRDDIQQVRLGDNAYLGRVAERARRWEHQGDDLLNQARALAERWPGGEAVPSLLMLSDDVIDALEEAAFLFTQVPALAPPTALLDPIGDLAELVTAAARAYCRAVEHAREVPAGLRRDLQDFLAAVDEVMRIEHESDEVHRRAVVTMLHGARDFRQMKLLGDIAGVLESSVDGLLRTVLELRRQVLSEVAA